MVFGKAGRLKSPETMTDRRETLTARIFVNLSMQVKGAKHLKYTKEIVNLLVLRGEMRRVI